MNKRKEIPIKFIQIAAVAMGVLNTFTTAIGSKELLGSFLAWLVAIIINIFLVYILIQIPDMIRKGKGLIGLIGYTLIASLNVIFEASTFYERQSGNEGMASLIEAINQGDKVAFLSLVVTIFSNFALVFAIYILSDTSKSKAFKDFRDVDKELNKEQELINKIISKIEENIDTASTNELLEKITELEKRVNPKQDTFEGYFYNLSNNFLKEVERSNQKASLLLTRGIWISILGIVLYILSIIIFQFAFKAVGFQTYNIFGLVSSTLLFIFVQFVGAWFLKQYRYFVDTSTYFIKLKANIDRYLLTYLLINENKKEGEAQDYLPLINLLSQEIKFPESYILKNPDISLAKEAFETSLSSLNETIKTLKGK